MANLSSLLLLCLFSLLVGHGVVELEASHHVYRELRAAQSSPAANQPYRTAFHFQPPKNWMNDPNGPMLYKGIYHLFYQYNPYAAVWGNITWAHSTSTDLVNWVPHKPAIVASQPSDINGCWSGSATMLPGGKPVILYTGINPEKQQVQNLAMPKDLSDPYLVDWVKSPKNPLMAPTPMNKINSSSFRDPTTAWLGPDGTWRVLIGNKRDYDHEGRALLYRSKDFVKWTEANHPLYSSKGSGMWECPDFYPVSRTSSNGVDTSTFGSKVKHVLKASLDDTRHDCYTIGTYDLAKDIFVPDSGTLNNLSLRYDHGKYYASKTFFDYSKKRRILWGWVNESTDATIDIMKGWSGLQAIPRKVWLDKAGKQLMQWPVAEILKLRTKKVEKRSQVLKGGSVLEVSGITAAQADVEIAFEVSHFDKAESLDPSWTDPQLLCSRKGASVKGGLGPFGLLVLASEGLQEYTAVFFRIFKTDKKHVVLMCSDQSRSSMNNGIDKTTYGAFVDVDPVHEKLSLRTLIDHSIVESFGGEGKACITARVYPTMAIDGKAHLYAFNYGSESVTISRLRAWSMKKAQIN
ncbi:Beta-fructofuranosidase [Bertholletia excelsa]